jgi:type II secretory pathway pseudopilin PulG
MLHQVEWYPGRAAGCSTVEMAHIRADTADQWGVEMRAVAAGRSDSGATLVEMLVALGLVALVASFSLTFQISSMSTMRTQADRQVAAQLASRALDTVRTTSATALLSSPPAPRVETVNQLEFTQRWSITPCRQRVPASGCTEPGPAPGTAEMVRVVVTVQWGDSGRTLTEQAAALVGSASVEPVFSP